MVEVINGNLVESKADVIIHQTNCCKGFGAGVAKAIKEKWPVVAEKHFLACDTNEKNGNPTSFLLGKIQPVNVGNGQTVINMFAQDNFGKENKRYTSYDALDECLDKVKEYCIKNGFHTIALPWKMSSDRGGANWNVVFTLIASKFEDNDDFKIEIRRL